jgi:DNA-directed RNA polymerase II subunit RPB11
MPIWVGLNDRTNQSKIRVEMEEDTKIPNAATFKIEREDHTLANMLRM